MRACVSVLRHCERSEAIYLTANGKMDCFVASLLAMTENAASIYDDIRQKEGPPKRAFEKSSCQADRDQAVLE